MRLTARTTPGTINFERCLFMASQPTVPPGRYRRHRSRVNNSGYAPGYDFPSEHVRPDPAPVLPWPTPVGSHHLDEPPNRSTYPQSNPQHTPRRRSQSPADRRPWLRSPPVPKCPNALERQSLQPKHNIRQGDRAGRNRRIEPVLGQSASLDESLPREQCLPPPKPD